MRTIGSCFIGKVVLLVGGLSVTIHLKGVTFGARLVMVSFLFGVLGVAIHLKGVTFGTGLMMVDLLVGPLGVGIYDLRHVLVGF